jgi:methionine-rich copper-binding protein CopC
MRIARTVAAALLGAGLAVPLGGTAPAWAHNSLTGAEPARNAVLDRAPDEIRLTFLQKPDPSAVTVELADAAQRPVAVGRPTVDGNAGVVSITTPLDNGVYTVTYRVVSRDGHPVRGSYRFTVDDPAAASTEPTTPAPAAPASSAAAHPAVRQVAGSSDDSGSSVAWLAAAGALSVVVGLSIAVLRRRASRTPK